MVAHCISRIGHRGSLPQKGGGLTTGAILQTALKISSWTQVQSNSNSSPIGSQVQSANRAQLNRAFSEPLHNRRAGIALESLRHRGIGGAPCCFHAPGKLARGDRARRSISRGSSRKACRASVARVWFTPAIPLTLMLRSLLAEGEGTHAPIHSWVISG